MVSDNWRFIDTAEFARLGSTLKGDLPLAGLPRFCEGLPAQPSDRVVSWSLKGWRSKGGQAFLQIALKAQPVLQCQRCLDPFGFDVDVVNQVEIVSRETDLDDEDLDDDAPERILGARRFDVLSFIEDELILAVPYVPRHEVCPGGVPAHDAELPAEEEKRPSPFSVLAQLKQNR